MGKWGVERVAAGSGILFVALFLAGFFAPGEEPPNLHDSNAEVIAFFNQHHRALLVSSILLSLGLFAFLWFLGSLGAALRRGGEPRLAGVALGGGVAATTMAFVAVIIQTSLAFRIPADAPGIAKALYDMQFVTFTMVGFPIGVLVGAVSVAAWRSRMLPQWFGLAGLLVTLVIVTSGAALAQKGFYAPDGAYGVISLIVFLAWTLAASGFLVMRPSADEVQATPTARAV